MGLEIITFQIGTDIVGQPIYYSHLVSQKESTHGNVLMVESIKHY